MKITHCSPIVQNANIVLCFDVETNGLLNTKRPLPRLEECPHTLQISYAMYDLDRKCLLKTVDSYVKIPSHVTIPPEAANVNKITLEMCNEGYPMVELLREFYVDYHLSKILVAHNYHFDSAMLNIELQRNWHELQSFYPYALNLFNPTYMRERKMRYKCTMMDSTDLCKIPHAKPAKEGKPQTFKWPTLIELHKHLFNYEPIGMHNSMMDVWCTLRCYLMMERNIVLNIVDDQIHL